MPGTTLARVRATCSKVLWSSFRTITIQPPSRSSPGRPVRGRSTVSVAGLTAAALLRGGDAEPDVVDAAERADAARPVRPDEDLDLAAGDLRRGGVAHARNLLA